ncbi:MAG: DNA-3-methyladenine glycosylase [Acidobacteria bacterium]|nr:DNA-3-methyladenine glycosylase [Acidobacteriota bacterium]
MPRRAGRVLPASFYARPTLVVARELLGARLVHETADGIVAGRIVEVEAYIGESDPGCHAAAGPTPRNRPLYEAPGHAYVYLNYGVHCLLNAVTEEQGRPAAVLLRAVEPLEGLALMRARRVRGTQAPLADAALCRGPGNLSRAFAVSLSHNRLPLAGALRIEAGQAVTGAVWWTRRIGLSRGGDRFWRPVVAGSAAVSGTRLWNADARPRPWPAHTIADRAGE